MSTRSAIAWTDFTWNPVVGCTQVSPGCAHCYAKALHDQRHEAFRDGKLQAIPQYAEPFEVVQLKPERLEDPLRWRQPRLVFVNSVSDLFHDDVPESFIDDVFAVMALAHRHTFQLLTKRPRRMHAYLSALERPARVAAAVAQRIGMAHAAGPWPLPNVWLGVSVENQRFADERIPLLVRTPAALRFLSCEPLLGPVSIVSALWRAPLEAVFANRTARPIGWVIAGGESGRDARTCDDAWLRMLRDECVAGGVPYFLKQLGGARDKRAGDAAQLDGACWTEMPPTTPALPVP